MSGHRNGVQTFAVFFWELILMRRRHSIAFKHHRMYDKGDRVHRTNLSYVFKEEKRV